MLSITDPVIPPGSWILVTGANGFIASHIIDQLLAAGYKVRATVRSAEKRRWLQELFVERYGYNGYWRLYVAEADDLGDEERCRQLMNGISGVIHTASVVTFSPDPEAVITPSVAMITALARAAAAQPSVKRFVFTSSIAAAVTPTPGTSQTVGPETYNENAIETASTPPPWDPLHGIAVYAASKALCEKKLFKWHKETRPQFDVTSVVSYAVFGPILSIARQGYPSSTGELRQFFDGDPSGFKPAWLHFVDVRDLAALHMAALLLPHVKNERLWAVGPAVCPNDALQAFRERWPKKCFLGNSKGGGGQKDEYTYEGRERAEQLLREVTAHSWTEFTDSLGDWMDSEGFDPSVANSVL